MIDSDWETPVKLPIAILDFVLTPTTAYHSAALRVSTCSPSFLAFSHTHLIPFLRSVQHCSTDVLEHILSHDECDVDPVNRISGATPLHIAVHIEDAETRKYIVESLLDAGADLT